MTDDLPNDRRKTRSINNGEELTDHMELDNRVIESKIEGTITDLVHPDRNPVIWPVGKCRITKRMPYDQSKYVTTYWFASNEYDTEDELKKVVISWYNNEKDDKLASDNVGNVNDDFSYVPPVGLRSSILFSSNFTTSKKKRITKKTKNTTNTTVQTSTCESREQRSKEREKKRMAEDNKLLLDEVKRLKTELSDHKDKVENLNIAHVNTVKNLNIAHVNTVKILETKVEGFRTELAEEQKRNAANVAKLSEQNTHDDSSFVLQGDGNDDDDGFFVGGESDEFDDPAVEDDDDGDNSATAATTTTPDAAELSIQVLALHEKNDHLGILNLKADGVPLTTKSEYKYLHQAYIKLCLVVHPDRNANTGNAAIQAVYNAFEHIAQPNLVEGATSQATAVSLLTAAPAYAAWFIPPCVFYDLPNTENQYSIVFCRRKLNLQLKHEGEKVCVCVVNDERVKDIIHVGDRIHSINNIQISTTTDDNNTPWKSFLHLNNNATLPITIVFSSSEGKEEKKAAALVQLERQQQEQQIREQLDYHKSPGMGAVINEEDVKKDNIIMADWKSKHVTNFCDIFKVLLEFKKDKGNLNVPLKPKNAITRLVINYRTLNSNCDEKELKSHELTQLATLNEIGFIWDLKSYHWNEYYFALLKHRVKHGNVSISYQPTIKNETNPDRSLGLWWKRIPDQYNSLSPVQKYKLKTVGYIHKEK